MRDAPDVFLAVGGAKAKVGVEAQADVVAVEAVGVVGSLEEGLLQSVGDGTLSARGEAGEPERETFLFVEGLALRGGEGGGVVGYVPVGGGGNQ